MKHAIVTAPDQQGRSYEHRRAPIESWKSCATANLEILTCTGARQRQATRSGPIGVRARCSLAVFSRLITSHRAATRPILLYTEPHIVCSSVAMCIVSLYTQSENMENIVPRT
jgi:hypothetical protein